MVYSASIERFNERDIRKIKARETLRQRRTLTFQFPNGDAERTFADVSSVSASWSTVRQSKGLMSAIFEKSKQEQLYAKVERLPPNFQTATLKERLPTCPPCPYHGLECVNRKV